MPRGCRRSNYLHWRGGWRVGSYAGPVARVTHLRFERDHQARSLVWAGDALVDIVGGGASTGLDGAKTPRTVNWAYTFDRALVSPGGRFQVLYAALNTKGLVVATGSRHVREIDRSYYHAHVYEYPVAVGALPDGREVLVHCPDGYNRLAIEMLAGGERLCAATEKASDVFHSRLQLSPGGRYLLSAGWIWHPLGVAAVYDIQLALLDGRHLDGDGVLPWKAVDAEVEAACWIGPETLAVSTNPEEEQLGE
jgi:hypothetical protein